MAIYMEQQQIICSASIPQRPAFTGVVLMDAIGKRYEMPIELAGSYEVCIPDNIRDANLPLFHLHDDEQIFENAIRLLFKNDTLEARVQRRYMEEGMYDLAIDGRDNVMAINGQQGWSEVQPGTTIVMRVILFQRVSTDVRKYQCPRCREWNYGSENSSSIDWSVQLPYVTFR